MQSELLNFLSFDLQSTSQQNTTKSLLDSVIQMGRIMFWKLSSNSEYTSGYILFEQPENAAQLLTQTGHHFAGAIVCFWEGGNLLHLNDHCLQRVFSLLEIEDLFSVAQVNERFKENAQTVFPLEHENFQLAFGSGTEPWNHDFNRFENFMDIFGAYIGSLCIDGEKLETSTVENISELLLRYGSNSIKDLHLYYFKCEDALILGPLFPGLKHLYIYKLGNLSDTFFDLLKDCHELRSLYFEEATGDFQSLQFNLPKLKTIIFESCDGLDPHQMTKFLESNPKLKEVMIDGYRDVGDNIYSVIGKHLRRIKKIGIYGSNFIEQSSFDQNAFASLEKLRIDGPSDSLVAVLRQLTAAKAPLEYLHLICPMNDELVDAICGMKALNTLYMEGYGGDLSILSCRRICENLDELSDLFVSKCSDLDADGLVEIVRTAHKLRTLHFYLSVTQIDDESYKSLVKILEKRAVKIPLKIFMDNEGINWPPHQTHEDLLTFHESVSDCMEFSTFCEME